MRVLWCHPNAWSGEYKMMAWLAAQGHEICVLQGDRSQLVACRLTPFFKEAGDGIQTFWYNPAKGAEKLLTWLVDHLFKRSPYRGNLGHRMWMIAAAARHFQPEVVYCSEGFGYGAAAALLKKLRLLQPAVVVQSIGGDFMDEPLAEYGTRRTRVSRWLLQQVLQHATRVKPVSPLLAGIMREMGGEAGRICMSPSHLVAEQSLLDRLHGQRARLRAQVRAQYGIASDVPVVVSLSGNWEGKGTHLLAAAWETIRATVPGCVWLLAGPPSPWYVEHVQPVVRRYPGEIIETGTLHGEAVFTCLAAADLNVNPTLADGLNMVTVEAAAVGTPSLVTDKAGIAHWVAQCGSDLVLPAGNVEALAAGVARFFALPSEQCQALSDAFHAMSAEFGVEHLGERLVAIWAEARDAGA